MMKYARWLTAAAAGTATFAAWHYLRHDEIVYIHNAAKEGAPQTAPEVPAAPAAPVTSASLRIPISPTLPDLPVAVTRRPSAVGRGFVGLVQNTGTSYLRLAAAYKNVTTGRTTTVNIEVGPNATVELGWLEKCPLASGDTLTLSHPNFKSRSWEF